MNPRQTDVSPLNVRDYNLSEVLRLIHNQGSMSRADISRETGLSATTISALANVLIHSGFVTEAGEAESSGGRPPILMQFKYQYRYALGVDLGATHITTVLIDMLGNPVVKRAAEFDAMGDAQGALRIIREHVSSILDEIKIQSADVLGIGVGAPAPLEGEQLDKLSPVILPLWKDVDLRREISGHFDNLPIYIDNDANAGALAEKWWGKGRGYSNLVYIKLGTGVGSGLIINNDIFRGSAGTAGEIGHTSISSNGPLCRCGNHGCMESYVGSPAIIANVTSKLKAGAIPGVDSNDIQIRDVAEAAWDGQVACMQIVKEAGHYLGIAIANLLNLINPGLIVIGGDLVAAEDVLLDSVRETALSRAIPKAGREVTIMKSDLGDDVVAIGAATLVFHHAFQPGMIASILNA